MSAKNQHSFTVRVLSHYTYEMISWECGYHAVEKFLTELPSLCNIYNDEIQYLFDLLPSEMSELDMETVGMSVAVEEEVGDVYPPGTTEHGEGWLTAKDPGTDFSYYFRVERGYTCWDDPLASLEVIEAASQEAKDAPARKLLKPAANKTLGGRQTELVTSVNITDYRTIEKYKTERNIILYKIEVVTVHDKDNHKVCIEKSLKEIRAFDQQWRQFHPTYLNRFPFPRKTVLHMLKRKTGMKSAGRAALQVYFASIMEEEKLRVRLHDFLQLGKQSVLMDPDMFRHSQSI